MQFITWALRRVPKLFRVTLTGKVAVLIDGDNVSHRLAPHILNQARYHGEPVIRRVYVNMAGAGKKWGSTISTQSLLPISVMSGPSGKNASDIALCVDAVSFLYTRSIDTFVLVSSDSDFTQLAVRLREHGKQVIGLGSSNTPLSFQKACSSFLLLEQLGAHGNGRSIQSQRWTLQPEEAEATLVLAIFKLGGTHSDVSSSLHRFPQERAIVSYGKIKHELTKSSPTGDVKAIGREGERSELWIEFRAYCIAGRLGDEALLMWLELPPWLVPDEATKKHDARTARYTQPKCSN